MREKIVVTGMGAVTPVGIGLDEYWNGLIEGVCGIRNCSGVCVFSYGYLFDPLTGTGQEWTKTERENFFSLWQTASFPAA